MTPAEFQRYERSWIGTYETAGMSRAACIDWMKSRPRYMKPRVRVKAPSRILARDVPDDAQPGDLVLGNRGAAARVFEDKWLKILYLEYAGNYDLGIRPYDGCKLHDFR